MPGHCSVCDVPLVGSSTWATMPPELREGRALSKGGGLCRKHYHRMKRNGDPTVAPAWTPRPVRGPNLDRDAVLDDWVELAGQGYSVRAAADRLGITFSALDKALWRARQRGDARGIVTTTTDYPRRAA